MHDVICFKWIQGAIGIGGFNQLEQGMMAMNMKSMGRWFIPLMVAQLMLPGCGGGSLEEEVQPGPLPGSPALEVQVETTPLLEQLLAGEPEELAEALEAEHALTDEEYYDAMLFILMVATAEMTGEMPGSFYELGHYQRGLDVIAKYPSFAVLTQSSALARNQGALFSASSDGTWLPFPGPPGYTRKVGKSFVCGEVCTPDWKDATAYAASAALWETLPGTLGKKLEEFVELYKSMLSVADAPLSVAFSTELFTNNPDLVGTVLDVLQGITAMGVLAGGVVVSPVVLKGLVITGLVLTVAQVGNKFFATQNLWGDCLLWQAANCTRETGHCPDDHSMAGLLEHQWQQEGRCVECWFPEQCTSELGFNFTCDYDTYLCIQLTTPIPDNNANIFELTIDGTTYTSGNITANANPTGTVLIGKRDNVAEDDRFFRVTLHLPPGEPNGVYTVNNNKESSVVYIEVDLEDASGLASTPYDVFFPGGNGTIEFNQVPKAEKNALTRVTGSYEGTLRSTNPDPKYTISVKGTFNVQDNYLW